MSAGEAREIIEAIRREIEEATDMMLSAAEKGLRDLSAARAGQETALEKLELTLCAILEACAFQDITGQRLTKLEAMIGSESTPSVDGDALLNGPAFPGRGLDQSAANALMGDAS